MRPLELSLQGFRSYRSGAVFDFQDRGLFGIVGPTGAGKSSILDGLIFALYGRTPRIGKDTKKLITSGEAAARVLLVFEVDGVAWEVTRVLREQGASQVVLHRQGNGGVEASGERNVNDRIAELVGLDYDAFCSSVTLPQGEFDRFLKATPAERSKILKRIFRYERVDAMRELAKQRVAVVDLELRSVQADLAALPLDPEALLAELESERREREERVAALREAVASFAAARAVVDAAEEDVAGFDRAVAQVEAVAARIPAAAALEALATAQDEAHGRRHAAQDALDAARAAADEAAQRAAQVEAELGGSGLAQARELTARRTRCRAEARGRRAALEELVPEALRAREASEAQAAVAEKAEAASLDAQQALQAARQAHAAHALRGDLRLGEPCPVCLQDVARLPEGIPVPPVLAEAERAAQRAGADAHRHRSLAPALAAAAASAEARLQAAQDQLVAAEREVVELDDALAMVLGAGVDPGAEVARREGIIAGAAEAAQVARRRTDAAADELAEAGRGVEEHARRRRRVAGELIAVATALGVEAPEIEGDAGELAGAAKRAGDAAAVLLAGHARRRSEVLAREAESRELLTGLAGRLGLGPGERIEDALQAASEAMGALGQRVVQAQRAIEERAWMEARSTVLSERRALYQRLAADLTDNKFIAYLLDAERKRLAEVGSEKLFELTSRYRFDDEGQFHLLDLANDVVRTPDTLSGGETFLASLALALALAEAVSEGGTRLECFFLDEGFGSLDAASLDLALDGVEALAVPGRLIGLISHVGGLQARLDDLIMLEKAADGSTIVTQNEGPMTYLNGAI